MQERLPNPQEVFNTYFFPWYPDDLSQREYNCIHPDIDELEILKGTHIREIQPLNQEGRDRAAQQIDGMIHAMMEDWPTIVGCAGDFSIDWIQEFEKKYRYDGIVNLIKQSPPDNYSNSYLILCCELGAAISIALQAEFPQLQWIYDLPYWDSVLFDLNSHTRIHPFHWAMKALSSEFETCSIADKLHSCVSLLEE